MHRAVFEKVRATKDPVVVFDIDSTLVSTAPRHLAILRAFCEAADLPELAETAASLDAAAFGWTVDGPLPDLDDATRSDLTAYWFEAFFSDRFLHEDQPVAGAVSFVRTLHDAGAQICYLTARNAETMGAGTLTSLHRMGFPLLEGRSTVHLKPHAGLADHAFKEAALNTVRQRGTVVATFENEPANANLFAEHFPDAVHVLLDTVHSPDAPTPTDALHLVPDFVLR